MIDLKKYTEFTRTTRKYPLGNEGDYVTAGLVGEVGELYSAIAKYHREDYDFETFQDKAQKEIGDIMWFLARFCDYYDWDLEKLIEANKIKLLYRLEKGSIKGDGDNR